MNTADLADACHALAGEFEKTQTAYIDDGRCCFARWIVAGFEIWSYAWCVITKTGEELISCWTVSHQFSWC